MTKTTEQTPKAPKNAPQEVHKAAASTPSTVEPSQLMNLWATEPERLFGNFFEAWRDMTKSMLPAMHDFGHNGASPKPNGDPVGLAAWQEQADRYFKEFNQNWLDIAKASTFNMIAPMNPIAMGAGVTINDNDGKYVVTAPLPGLDEDDIDLRLDDGFLIITGKKTDESEQEKNGTKAQFWHTGDFRYLVRLPDGVVTEKIKADYSKGVLTVSMPKTVAAKTEPKKIKVNG